MNKESLAMILSWQGSLLSVDHFEIIEQ